MRKSSIAKQFGRGQNSGFALALGDEIRRRRQERGLTQSELGYPLTKGFVSGVERGRTLPSLGVVCLFADRLGMSVADLFRGINNAGADAYTAAYERHEAPSSSGGQQ